MIKTLLRVFPVFEIQIAGLKKTSLKHLALFALSTSSMKSLSSHISQSVSAITSAKKESPIFNHVHQDKSMMLRKKSV
jgi:hypothetical protein